MSDAIREAFEAWYQDHPWHHTSDERTKAAMADAWQAALQSQTAPVPYVTAAEELIGIVEGIQNLEHGTWTDSNGGRLKDTKEWVQFYLSVRNSSNQQVLDSEKLASALREIEGTVNRTATSDQFIRHLKQIATDALTAAPQPDHSPDAGKVVQGELVGWVVERDGDSTFPHFYFDKNQAESMVSEVELLPFATMRPVYTHPAPQPVQSENEAKLVKEAYDAGYSEAMLYARVCCGRLDNPENTTDYRDCARFLDLIFEGEINEAARLRTAGDDGKGV